GRTPPIYYPADRTSPPTTTLSAAAPQAGPMALNAGSHVGSYIVEGLVGSGGMADVYRVRHRALGSVHALKVLRRDLVLKDDVRARFLDEGRVQARLRHPGLVRVTDLVSEPGVAGLVMDLLHGEDLAQRLLRGPLPVPTAAAWMIQALHAVTYAHVEGVVHRDLKPANLFLESVDARVRVRVLDFGIAKVKGVDRRTRGTLGTFAYMAPEQIEAPATIDQRADVFALGAVLYEMVTGHAAFEDDTDYATMQRILGGQCRAFDPVPNPQLAHVLSRALQVDRDQRYATCMAFVEDLRALADSSAAEAPSGPRTPTPLTVFTPPSLPASVAPTMADPLGTAQAEPAKVDWSVVTPPSIPAHLQDPIPTLVAPPTTTDATAHHHTAQDPASPLDPRTPAALPTRTSRRQKKRARRRDVEPIRRRLARSSAVMQLLSGAVNVGLMWVLPCTIIGPVATDLSLSPDPSQNLWGLCLGCGIGLTGLLELIGGLFVLGSGGRRWRLSRNLAWLQLLSVLSGGIVSGAVGMIVLLLFASVPRARR
ncbi:MAG: serine/threonine protein kinase, partial [Kiritimatiellia bacterium]